LGLPRPPVPGFYTLPKSRLEAYRRAYQPSTILGFCDNLITRNRLPFCQWRLLLSRFMTLTRRVERVSKSVRSILHAGSEVHFRRRIFQSKPVYASVHKIMYTRSVPEKITIPVAGGCPKCGNPNLMVHEDYSDDTIVTCSKCKYKARWVEFFPPTSTGARRDVELEPEIESGTETGKPDHPHFRRRAD
jgi:hypothetical protein